MNNQETYKMTDEELLERMRKYSETMNVLSAGSTKKGRDTNNRRATMKV